MAEKIFTITQLNNYIKRILDADDVISGVYVKGELSNYKVYPSGHHYFTMKDTEGSLKCVMFKGSAIKLRFKPENGMSVVAFGKVSVYPRDGLYQLYVSEITPDGIGDLYVAFEQLKEKLYKEGLFDEIHKKPLPRFPRKIAVITSPAGAAVQDIIRVLGSRWKMSEVVIMPVRVQGIEAPPEIVSAIEQANKIGEADVIITGRGGGSIEDLWAFNDETVARAIFKSKIPVISAVGHEPDVTIADFVADVRAATPSNAAELAVPDAADVYGWLKAADIRLNQTIHHKLRSQRQRLDSIAGRRVLQSPEAYIDNKRVQIDRSTERLLSAARFKISNQRQRFTAAAAAIDAMSPLKVLGRGYAIAHRADGLVVKNAHDVSKGDLLKVRLQKDEINCIVE
ncbi:MAG: exodeoxyribonuclease VII large subunit [Oscillospiraceae bacterium]|nr:exodeoxyribonuclease VII large subunit [Oscillospiraceae bacterium]